MGSAETKKGRGPGPFSNAVSEAGRLADKLKKRADREIYKYAALSLRSKMEAMFQTLGHKGIEAVIPRKTNYSKTFEAVYPIPSVPETHPLYNFFNLLEGAVSIAVTNWTYYGNPDIYGERAEIWSIDLMKKYQDHLVTVTVEYDSRFLGENPETTDPLEIKARTDYNYWERPEAVSNAIKPFLLVENDNRTKDKLGLVTAVVACAEQLLAPKKQ